MINIVAVLIACHNRKEKTIGCIQSLFESKNNCSSTFELDVYLTDNGSVDGTASEVKKLFPAVNVLIKSDTMFWAGGMRNSWNEALRTRSYDAFLLLNDDVLMDRTCFDILFKAHEYSIKKYGFGSIYIGSIRDKDTLEYEYGGRLLLNKWTQVTKKVIPDGNFNECQLGNANIMLVDKKVVERIGILDDHYVHAKADYDYTLRALESKFPILVCSDYCGYCIRDHSPTNLKKMDLKERIRYLKNPKGTELKGYMYYMWRFFPLRAPFVYCSLWLKTLIPGTERIINKIMGR